MQQVNLYTDAFKPRRVVLPLEQIILLPIAVLVLLVGVGFWLNYSLKQEANEIQQMQLGNQELSQKLEQLAIKANRLKKDESLVAANERLREKAQARQQMIDMLDTVVVKDDEGFSNILISLARQRVDKLWLSSIYIGASGKEMHIEGVTLNGDLVPEYLQKLRKEDSFLGRTFTVFELAQKSGSKNQLEFSLRSEEQGASPEVLLSQLDTNREILNYARETVGGEPLAGSANSGGTN